MIGVVCCGGFVMALKVCVASWLTFTVNFRTIMKKCFKCGGTEIVTGSIEGTGERSPAYLFRPKHKIRFLAVTIRHGTELDKESYACLSCGTVWSQTNGEALRDFIRDNCKPLDHCG